MIDSAMVKLIQNEPFFANLLMNMTRTITTDIPTLGVNVTDTVNLYINPYFWESLTLLEQVDVLKHEALHVLNNHFARFKDLEPETFNNEKKTLGKRIEAMENASLCNQAADFAINEMLPNIPKNMKLFDKEGKAITYPETTVDDKGNEIPHPQAGQVITGKPCLVDELKKEMNNPKILNHQHTEYYYEILKQKQKEDKAQGKGQSQMILIDDHSVWGEGEQDEEFVKEKIKQVVAKAVEQSGGREAGKIPGDILTAIEALFYKPKDWKNDLQKFAARTSEIIVETSRKSRNRRYGVIYPGSKVFPKLSLCVIVDTSGSMPDEALSQAWAEIGRIHKNEVKVTVIEADCAVQNVYEFDPKKTPSMKGRGGTAYNAPIKKAEELKVDGIIYIGDMDCSDTPDKPKIPLLWCIYGNQEPPVKWGSKTKMEIKKK